MKAAGQCMCIDDIGPSCTSDTQGLCESKKCAWTASNQACETMVIEAKNRIYNEQQTAAAEKVNGKTVGAFLPSCLMDKKLNLQSECGDITIFLVLMFNIITYLFSIIGGVALLFFVYGGFVFVLSEGNSEKITKGKNIIIAAVLGIAIAFGGYALVRFVGEVVGIQSDYRLQ